MGLGKVPGIIDQVLARGAARPIRFVASRPQGVPEAQNNSDKKPLALESTPRADRYTLLKELARERIAPIGRDASHRSSGYEGLKEAASKVFGGKAKYVQAFNAELERRSGIKQGEPGAREEAVLKANKDLSDQAFLQTRIAGFGRLEKASPEKQTEFYNTLIALASDKANKAASKFESLRADKKNGIKEFTQASVDFTISRLFIKQIQEKIKSIDTQAKTNERAKVGRRLAAA